ncbi:unnamed protein product [Psylliodes chrysocephalus]|uniref:C2H2-type domain-containing protein n=1 Tax=Psylliodes chrysocephalus TaxID=3402493 RepID=A0A9P0G8C1_9CUCU|nr:unnamed protein product [Psylliodes chrysocephala]
MFKLKVSSRSNGKLFHCEKCGNSYTYIRCLKRHMLACGKEKRLTCSFCSHKTHRQDHLNLHMFHKHNIVPQAGKPIKEDN